MSDSNAPFKFAGFVVGMDTSTQTLLIRPSNIVVDDTGKKYGVGIINPQQGILIAFENNKSYVKIKHSEKEGIYEKLNTIFLNRSKIWLTLLKSPQDESSNLDIYVIKNISWTE